MNKLRDTIEKLSRCKFDYSTPEIILSVDRIEINLEEGKDYSGTFTIMNTDNIAMKGIVYSSNEIITFPINQFTDAVNQIQYNVAGRDLIAGESYHIEIVIISNCGEVMIPVQIQVEVPFCNTSLGKIKDLFQYASLAKEDWIGALELFKSDEFERVFLHNDSKNQMIYHNLMKNNDLNRALEEFLNVIHKKVPINLQINKQTFEFKIYSDEFFMDKIVITKDTWGYLEAKISTDTPFLSLEHTWIKPENFIGSTYNLEFVINPLLLRDGKNFGQIFIKTYNQTMVIDIVCHYVKETRNREEHHHQNRECEIELTKVYLRFRSSMINLEQYIVESESLLNKMSSSENQVLYTMLQTHLYIITNQSEKAAQMLDTFLDYESDFKKSSGIEYCGYLYLKAMHYQEQETIDQAIREIRYIYENGLKDYRILWFLLYLDKNYEENVLYKLAQIKEQVLSGTHSPILYFEALNIYNTDPSSLHELGEFELQVMDYGIHNDSIAKETAAQFTYLATREKTFRYNVFKNLEILYDKYYTEEILNAICTILIKGQKTATKYFSWYRLGVEAGLKITQLHESYMYSIDEENNIILSAPILLYFIYNSNLSDNKKAYLYAYIIRNKEQNPSIYRTYLKQMENFCLKQIGLHNINHNLAIIYEDLLTKDMITESIADDLPYIMFRHILRCDNQEIKGVIVEHKELNTQTFIPLTCGEAQINLFTENAEIFLVDYNDNRYVLTIDYTLTKLMNSDRYIDACYSYNIDNPMLLLSLSEKLDKYQKLDDNAVIIRGKVIGLINLREEYLKRYLWALIQYHYDIMDGDYLKSNLSSMNIRSLDKSNRVKLIEYAIISGMYTEVLDLITVYGYVHIPAKRLLKLCRGLITGEYCQLSEDYKKILVGMCFHVFRSGKYDDSILLYLIEYYYGTTKNMYDLWKISKETKLNTTELEERLLGQILFAKSYIGNAIDVFNSYYIEGHNSKLVKAFLSFYSYRYLVHDRVVNDDLFHIIQKELVLVENEVCMLALLKYISTKSALSDEEIKFANYHVYEYLKKGFFLPFFQEFKKSFLLPQYISDKFYIEYKTDPKKNVVIHYRMNNNSEEEFIVEPMKNVYMGIHVKEFVIFYNEELQYYITEEDMKEENIIVSDSIKLDKTLDEEENSKYNSINLMLMARELKDDKTLVQIIKNYMKNEFIMNGLFKIK